MNKFLSKKWLGIPLVTIMAIVLGIGAVAAAYVAVSNLWTSPKIVVTNAITPTHRALVISSTWLSDGAVLTGSSFDFPMTLSNPSDAGDPDYANVNVDIKSWNATELTSDIKNPDLTLYYNDGSTWQVIPTNEVNSNGQKLEATFGPDAGFTVAAGYNVTTQFRVVFHNAGTYQASAQAQTH